MKAVSRSHTLDWVRAFDDDDDKWDKTLICLRRKLNVKPSVSLNDLRTNTMRVTDWRTAVGSFILLVGMGEKKDIPVIS